MGRLSHVGSRSERALPPECVNSAPGLSNGAHRQDGLTHGNTLRGPAPCFSQCDWTAAFSHWFSLRCVSKHGIVVAMNRRPLTLVVALVAVLALVGGAMAVAAAWRNDVTLKPQPPAASEAGAAHAIPETQLTSNDEARAYAGENAVSFARWILLPPGGLFTVTPSPGVTVAPLGEGNKPSWAGTWTVTVTSREVPAFRQRYTQSMTFGPGTSSQSAPYPRDVGGLDDPAVFQRIGALPQPERVALLRFLAQRSDFSMRNFDRLSIEVGIARGLSDKERFFRDRLLALGVSRGYAPTHLVWVSFDDPSATDRTPYSLLLGYSAKRRTWVGLASARGAYSGKLATLK